MRPVALTIAILAGGQSRRMGRDKARLVLHGDGETLLVRTARTAREAGCPVLVVGRGRPADFSLPGVAFVEDQLPGLGPLGGLLTALGQGLPAVLALGCDMPWLTAAGVSWLLGEAGARTLDDGLVTRSEEHLEPLFSIYTAACLPLIERQLASGQGAMRALIRAGDFACAEAPAWLLPELRSVNIPADLQGFRGP